jgi:hypothetical protein
MIKFHKNGITLLKDATGRIFVFDPDDTLNDVAEYIWNEPTLKHYTVEEDRWESPEDKEIVYVELKKEKKQRLRNLTKIMDDQYYKEEV